ncbi:MAG: hypothetical protein AB7O84_23930 [Planctomycetota bacterium]
MPRLLSLCVPALAGCLAAQSGADAPSSVNWNDLTKSGLPIRFYGFFRLDAYYDTARFNSVILPATVVAENAGNRNDDEFFLDPRLTRFGLDVVPQEVNGARIGGRLETDFANFPTGGSESRATPRIRLAYIDIDKGDYGFRIGQDWDTISPLYPAVNGELLQWNAGNLGDRRTQIQARCTPKDASYDFKVALGMSGVVNGQDLDSNSRLDGVAAGMPHLQVRGGCTQELFVDKKPAKFGAWGALGRTEVDTAINGETRFDTWLAGIDVELPLCESVTLRGEAWTGTCLGDFRGGIGQTVNGAGREIESTGGWGEFVWKEGKCQYHLGASTDDPEGEDLAPGNPNRNLVGYLGTVRDWDCGLRTGLDVLYWQTDYAGGALGNAVRFDLYFVYSF